MTLYQKLMCVFLVFTIIFVPVAIGFAQTSDRQDHWANDVIQEWTDLNLITGYEDGSFKPNHSITRAEFMTLANRAFGFIEIEEGKGFPDVKPDAWYANEVQKAITAGYIGGYEDGTMKPNQPISRQEVAVIITKIQGISLNQTLENLYKDTIPEWSKGSIAAIANAGIMGGYPDHTFRPTSSITRAEVVVTLDRVLKDSQHVYKQSGTYGPTTGIEEINGNVRIVASNVTLQNVIINGNLIIDETVGEGNVSIKGVTVKGQTYIYGGGENSVYFQDTILINVVVNKKRGTIRIVVSGNSEITKTIIYSPANIELSSDAKIIELVVEELTKVLGSSVIEKAFINFNGIKFETLPKEIVVKDGVSDPTKIEITVPQNGGGANETPILEITGHSTLADVSLNTDQGLLDIERLKGSRVLPNEVELTTETGTVTATITDWTGSYDGKVPGTYTLTAEYTIPTGYRQGATPEEVTVNVVVSTIQTEEITGYSPLVDMTLNTDQGLLDIVRLKGSGILPTEVELITETGTAAATITDWTGAYDGKVPGTYTLSGAYTLPTGYRQGSTLEEVTVNVIVSTVQTEEITGYNPLVDITLTSDDSLIDMERLKASGALPTQVELTTESGTVDALITDWTGAYDGKVPGTYTLTAVYSLPAGYRQGATLEEVTVNVVVSTVQTEEITGYNPLVDVTLTSDDSLIDIERLKASGALPTEVELITETGIAAAAMITDWTGAYDGKVPGTYTLTAAYTLPAGYRQGSILVEVTVNVVVSTIQTEKITGYSPLVTVSLNTDQGLLDIARLKVSGVLPTEVELITETGIVAATITDWTGAYDGKVPGTYPLTAAYALPTGYRQGSTLEEVTVNVVVSTIQTEEIIGYNPLVNVTLTSDDSLIDMERLKASGILPTQVELTTVNGTITATITNWNGMYVGKMPGTYTLTATYTVPMGYSQGTNPVVVQVNVVVWTVQTEEITAHISLPVVTVNTEQGLQDIARLRTSGVLPTHVDLTTESGTVTATITNWNGMYDGKMPGTYTLTAVYALPLGYRQGATPEEVTVNVDVIYQEDSRIASISPTTFNVGDYSNFTISIVFHSEIDFNNFDGHRAFNNSFFGDFENIDVSSIGYNSLTKVMTFNIRSGSITNNSGVAILVIPFSSDRDIIIHFDTID